MNDLTTTNDNRAFATPPVDIFEGDEGYLLAIDLPGVKKDDIAVQLDNGKLSVDAHRGEREQAMSYRRVFDVDRTVDHDKLSAELADGVLTLRLPRAERQKPVKIPVAVR